MEVKGDTIKFHHVRHLNGADRKEYLIMVQFDGEPEWWYVAEGSTCEQALGELEIYYRRDWANSGRPTLPATVFKHHAKIELTIDR